MSAPGFQGSFVWFCPVTTASCSAARPAQSRALFGSRQPLHNAAQHSTRNNFIKHFLKLN